MLRNRFRVYLFLQVFVVLGVIFCFRIIPEKKWASIAAGSLFFWSSIGVLVSEAWFFKRERKLLVIIATVFFLVVFIIPVMALRIVNWEQEFSQIYWMGLSGSQIHKISNFGFMLMLISYFIESFRENKKGL